MSYTVFCRGNRDNRVYRVWNFFGAGKFSLGVNIEDEVEMTKWYYGFIPWTWKFRGSTNFGYSWWEGYMSIYIKPKRDCTATVTPLSIP